MHGFVLWMQRELLPSLGPLGVFLVAFVDSSFLSIPEVNDVFVITSSAARPSHAWFAVLLTTVGSVAGSSALWLVGKRGGEPYLVRRFGAERVEQTRQAFRRWDLLALAVPAVLPPPMPFKIFVFSAGVFGVPYPRFLATLVLARGLRYGGWGLMGALYGEAALARLAIFDAWFMAHGVAAVGIFLVVVLVGALVLIRRRVPRASAP